MALRPCARCHRRYRGAAQWMYPAILCGTSRFQDKYSLCSSCFSKRLDEVSSRLAPVTDQDGYTESDEWINCVECLEPVNTDPIYAFCTMYPRGEERLDFGGEAHFECLTALQLRLGIRPQDALGNPVGNP